MRLHVRCHSVLRATLYIATIVAALLASASASAIGPPTAGEVEKMRAAGVFEERMERAQRFGLYRLQPGLQQKAIRKVQIEARGAMGGPFHGPMMAFPYTKPPELKSQGTVRTLTILIDFANHRAATELPGMTPQVFEQNIYGSGTNAAKAHVPYESLNAYYKRASNNMVDIQGHVLGCYHFSKNRQDYAPTASDDVAWNRAILAMVTEAMKSFDANHDFTQYDNDPQPDGDIDLVTILYAGPPGEWMSFWWAYRWEFFVPEAEDIRFDGKRLRQFVFQFVDPRSGNDFNPQTLIHEMGHAFGLPDYYDYKRGVPSATVDGGLGGLDMMDHNWGNHNAFSRWLLDWIQPEVIGSGAPVAKTLVASGSAATGNRAIAIFPRLMNTSAPGQEMFIIENRFRTGNDGNAANMPNNGMLIWHIDATPKADNSGFLMDNSYTEHKLIRLVRADSETDFGANGQAGPGTYFRAGSSFTPTSRPNSNAIDGTPTGVSVTQLSPDGEEMSAQIGFEPPPGAPAAAIVATAPKKASPKKVPPEPASLTGKIALASSQPPGEPVDFAKLETLYGQLQAATPQQLKTAWEETYDAKRLSSMPEQASIALQILLTQLAAKDGEAAVKTLLKLPPSRLAARAFPAVMEAWAYNDPKGASQWYLDPKQKAIRTSKTLIAGEQFTKTVYKWLTLKDPGKAISSIDSLEHTSQISAALEGMLQAKQAAGLDALKLDIQVAALERNGETVRAILGAHEAIDAAEKAIKDPKKRSDFRKFIQQRGAE